ncbi:hypothetical protein VTG60DRAFT_5393 [Thermothelomyces hinnuleus]
MRHGGSSTSGFASSSTATTANTAASRRATSHMGRTRMTLSGRSRNSSESWSSGPSATLVTASHSRSASIRQATVSTPLAASTLTRCPTPERCPTLSLPAAARHGLLMIETITLGGQGRSEPSADCLGAVPCPSSSAACFPQLRSSTVLSYDGRRVAG